MTRTDVSTNGAIAIVNAQAKLFWTQQSQETARRLEKPQLQVVALGYLAAEELAQLPMHSRKSFEGALEAAEELEQMLKHDGERATNVYLRRYRRLDDEHAVASHDENFARKVRSQAAQKAGEAKKADALTLLIRQLVVRNPAISPSELQHKLKEMVGIEPIEDVDTQFVHFRTAKGAPKKAALRGLRGRLSRVKAESRRTQTC